MLQYAVSSRLIVCVCGFCSFGMFANSIALQNQFKTISRSSLAYSVSFTQRKHKNYCWFDTVGLSVSIDATWEHESDGLSRITSKHNRHLLSDTNFRPLPHYACCVMRQKYWNKKDVKNCLQCFKFSIPSTVMLLREPNIFCRFTEYLRERRKKKKIKGIIRKKRVEWKKLLEYKFCYIFFLCVSSSKLPSPSFLFFLIEFPKNYKVLFWFIDL